MSSARNIITLHIIHANFMFSSRRLRDTPSLEKEPFQTENGLPIIIFPGRSVVFSGGSPTLRQFFFVTYIATIAFGLIRVITAVFLRDTLDAAAMDAEEQVGDFVGLHLQYLNAETTGSLNRKFEFFGGRRNMSNFYADLCLIKNFNFSDIVFF